jgi:hypothetical protein
MHQVIQINYIFFLNKRKEVLFEDKKIMIIL